MPGFCIYAGELVEQQRLTEVLKDYESKKTKRAGDRSYELLEKIIYFTVKENKTIQFTYQWDEIRTHNFRGEIQYTIRTYYLNARIVTYNSHLYFMVENKRNAKTVLNKLAKILYKSTERILTAHIVSDVIKDIEIEDSSRVENEWYKKVSSRDMAVGIYGLLDEKQEDGKRGSSEVHNTFKNREKTASIYLSESTGARVYISAKKSSVTLRGIEGANISLDDVEKYISNNVLPEIVIESTS
jgi:hypothetical protein